MSRCVPDAGGPHCAGGFLLTLWRYYVWAKHLELSLGGVTAQLLRIGDALAAGCA